MANSESHTLQRDGQLPPEDNDIIVEVQGKWLVLALDMIPFMLEFLILSL